MVGEVGRHVATFAHRLNTFSGGHTNTQFNRLANEGRPTVRAVSGWLLLSCAQDSLSTQTRNTLFSQRPVR
jgi:hypothetical protein